MSYAHICFHSLSSLLTHLTSHPSHLPSHLSSLLTSHQQVMANNNEMILLPVNEPTFGTKR